MVELLVFIGGALGVVWLYIKGRSEGKTIEQAKQSNRANKVAKEVSDAQEANRNDSVSDRRKRMFGDTGTK